MPANLCRLAGVILTLLVGTALVGCGTQASGDNGSGPTTIEVPDVTGEKADDAQSEIEDAGLTASFDPEPDDPSLCDVTDQDETGEVEEGTEVVLTLDCKVDVPDTTGETADEAETDIQDAGPDLTVTFDPEPDDPSACTVSDQDLIGEAEPDDEVTLSVDCESSGGGGGGGGRDCEPSYPDDCLDPDAEDYDCEGGEGDGPEYVTGPITVDHSAGSDPFGLDRDGDGVACE